MARGITWDVPMSIKVRQGYDRFKELLAAEFQKVAKLMEAFAKSKHPWRNRTGKAERTFTVRVISAAGSELAIEAKHGVHYGKWLELKYGGRWGIIPATLQEGNRLLSRAAAVAWVGAWGFS